MRNLSGKDVNGMGKGRWQHVLLTVTMRSRKANIWSQRTSASYQSRVRCKAHARFIRGESAARRLPILIPPCSAGRAAKGERESNTLVRGLRFDVEPEENADHPYPDSLSGSRWGRFLGIYYPPSSGGQNPHGKSPSGQSSRVQNLHQTE